MNLAGVAFAIAAIVLYCINIGSINMWWLCNGYYYDDFYGATTTPSPEGQAVRQRYLEKCQEGKKIILVSMCNTLQMQGFISRMHIS